MAKLLPSGNDLKFGDHFSILRPKFFEPGFQYLSHHGNQMIVLQPVKNPDLKFRGQVEYLAGKNQILFFGAPWFDDISQMRANGFTFLDFAFHDPSTDFLQVLKNQEIITNDIKELLSRINRQKKELEKTTQQLRDNQSQLKILSRIAELTINAVIITDAKGYIEWVNDSFVRITGYTLEEVIGKKPGHVLQGEETDLETSKYMSKQISEGKDFVCEILNYHKNGEKYWIKVFGHPILDEDGKVSRFFALEEDITISKKTEQALRDAKEKADASAMAKNIFLTNMSHEIRTPLNAIMGMGQQLTKTNLNEKQLFYLDTMNSAAENLLVIINDILDLSRIEAGKLNLENIHFNPRTLINRCINVMSPKANEKGLYLTANIDDEIAANLIGDPYRLNQMLLNLLSNSLKFTEKGSVSLSLRLMSEKHGVQSLKFEVKDTGIGIEEKFKANLFNKFTQEDESIVRKFGGTGLGLNITKKLVELMGGSIHVESKKNTGSTFSLFIDFPVSEEKEQPVEKGPTLNPEILRGREVLVVEDNLMNRILARIVLQNFGANVSEAESGFKAISLCSRFRYDIIIMDIQMPGMDGYQTTQHIRNGLCRNVPIIALTANALKGEKEKCLAAGMDAYASKPFSENDLIVIVAKLLGITGIDVDHKEEIKLYDLKFLEEVSRGDRTFIKTMIEAFIMVAEEVKSEIPDNFQQGNIPGVEAAAHKLKSNVDTLQVHSLKPLIRQIESEARNGNKNETLGSAIDDFSLIIENVLTQLKGELLAA